MSDKHRGLIDELANAVEKNDRSLMSIKKLIPFWLLSFVCLVLVGMLVRAPFRENWVDQLSQPHFFLEAFFGLTLCITICIAAFQSSIPGLSNRMKIFAVSLGALWVSVISFPIFTTGIEQTMLGKRDLCYYEAVAYSIPAGLLIAWVMRRRYSVQPLQNALLSGFSVTVVPAFIMQYACMHEAYHALTHHLLPAVAVGLGVAVLIFMLRKIDDVAKN